MATLSSPGIGTGGLDVKSIISQLVKLEQRPLESLKLQAATTTTKISAFGQVQSLVSSLKDAADKLGSLSSWNAMTASSSSDFVTATAGGSLLETSFDVDVISLAKTQRTASAAVFASQASVNTAAGRLNIELGSWNDTFSPGSSDAGAFTANATRPMISVDIDANATLNEIASAINGAKSGVTATILTKNGEQSLLLSSKETGEKFGFNITAQNRIGEGVDATFTDITDNTGLGGLATKYISTATGAIQKAANAQATVNGIAVSSATNTFEGSDAGVSGVTFKVEKASEGKLTSISVNKDNTAIQANIEAFVKAYNEINKMLNEGTKYDAATKSAGLFQGDTTAMSLQNSLRAALQSVGEGSGIYQRLADIGVVQKTSSDPAATAALGGELMLDVSKLNKALASNPDDVKKLLLGANNDGIASKMKMLTSNLLASDGFFKSKDNVLKASLKRNENDQIRVNNQVNSFEQRLTARYTALDVQMSSLNALNAYISQQVTTWNKSNG